MQVEVSLSRIDEYIDYHFSMYDIGDIDPTYPLLLYVCERFELNIEQRYWLAWLYAMTYCGATVYYIYNEFPDFENVDYGRLERWWNKNIHQLIFQTDRFWMKIHDRFLHAFLSYQQWIGDRTQAQRFEILRGQTPEGTYQNAYRSAGQLHQIGRFALFLYLEAVHVVTSLPMVPWGIDWKNAESSRNGLVFALGQDDWLRGKDGGYSLAPLPDVVYGALDYEFAALLATMKQRRPEARVDVWNVETTLCAYKKWKHGQRYPGYYIDRQGKEIVKMQGAIRNGVHWGVLWDFRRETFDHRYLQEIK